MSNTFCDWCGNPVTSYYTGDDNTVSCRPCIDKGLDLRGSTSDEFFQQESVVSELTSRAKTKHNSTCTSGEVVDGVMKAYTKEYRRWKFKSLWATGAVCLDDTQRKQWLIDNPAPEIKFK